MKKKWGEEEGERGKRKERFRIWEKRDIQVERERKKE